MSEQLSNDAELEHTNTGISMDAQNQIRSQWRSECNTEVNFWNNYIKTMGEAFQNDYPNRLNAEYPLQPHILEHIQHLSENEINILDVGAGPLTVLGKRWPPKKIRITAVDPLADDYDAILEKAGITPPVRSTWCHGELLLERFKPNSFDLAYAQNSLDHSYNPLLVIKNMLTLVKLNCYVLLEHAQNEAENENYIGLHQWNFDIENDNFIIWNKQFKHNVTKLLAPYGEVTFRLNKNIRWLIVSIKKQQTSS